MRQYLGSKITAFAAVVAPLFVVGSIVFSAIMLYSKITVESIVVVLGCITCSVVWGMYIKKYSFQLYAWGTFGKKGITIKTGLTKKYTIDYNKCRHVGIAMYNHGLLNSNIGTKVFFIFFSYGAFEEEYRLRINLWKPSSSRVKVEFNNKLYNYLLSVLPKKQAATLQHDYCKYIAQF